MTEPPPTPPDDGSPPDSSVMRRIEVIAGAAPRIHLREAVEENTPVVRVQPGREPEHFDEDPRYQALGEIARGGVGVIFKGRDKDLGRDVALKVLRSDHLGSQEAVQRFIEEAQIGGQLLHPGVVPVYGLGLQRDGRPFFSMRLVRGRTLGALLEDRADPGEDRRRLLTVYEQVCQTMAYAHARGVIHRDLKPANIMVGSFGEVQVMDWGFSKVLGRRGRDVASEIRFEETIATIRTSAGSDSVAGLVMGTPSYMPPEQALGKVDEIDERCDVFALGALLCEILTGRAAYDAQGKEALIMAAQGRLEEANERLDRSGADPELVRLARRCLAPERAERPRDAGAVARAVSDYLAAAEERARANELRAAQARAREQQERAHAQWEQRLRQRGLAVAGTVVVAILGGLAAWLWSERADRAQAAEVAPRVRAALDRAALQQAAGDWSEAVSSAEAAWRLAETGGADAVMREQSRQRYHDLLALEREADARAERDAADANVLHRLRRAAACHAPGAPVTEVDDAYARAFAEYGVDPDALEGEEARARIEGSAVRAVLVAALDDWAWLRRTETGLENRPWKPLAGLARMVDPDAWRGRLRDALGQADATIVRELARQAEGRDERDLALAGCALQAVGAPDDALRLLRAAHAANPGSFWLALRLARAAAAVHPPQYEEAARGWTIAQALEPGCNGIRQQLAWTRLEANDAPSALATFEAVAGRDPALAREWLERAREHFAGQPVWPGFEAEARARLARAGGPR